MRDQARTAGAAALAARLLRRSDATVLAVLGAGAAGTHVRVHGVRDWASRIAGRDHRKAQELAAGWATAAASFEDAVRGADVVAALRIRPSRSSASSGSAPAHVSSVGATQTGGGSTRDRRGRHARRRDTGGARPAGRRRRAADSTGHRRGARGARGRR